MDEVTFRVDRWDDDGNYLGSTEQKFMTEGYLVDMNQNYLDFLRGMSFGYVDDVIAIKNDGVEVGTE
jgi:hypothetical protein|tara:strand:- start:371 stop:571 length:201 start_codon:yes stop_codon:yes gene_type:complete